MEKLENTNDLQLVTSDYLQMMPIAQTVDWYNQFCDFTKSILKKDLDFGIIPGTNAKPSLFKAGAEKLRFVYGLGIEVDMIDKLVDYDRPLIDYTYKCSILDKSKRTVAQCEGNCNSLEPKFGYIWVQENEIPSGTDKTKLKSKQSGKKLFEFDFAINKAETSGQYGKPAEYWNNWKAAQKNGTAKKVSKKSKAGKDLTGWELDETVTVYRITNPDVIGMKNTIMKMAQKRAFVGAILLATGASEFFTQDIEDMEINGKIYSQDSHVEDIAHEVVSGPATDMPAEEKSEEIPGHWYAKLEKCKTPEDVDVLGKKHSDTINASKALRKLFVATKDALKKKMIKENGFEEAAMVEEENDLPFPIS